MKGKSLIGISMIFLTLLSILAVVRLTYASPTGDISAVQSGTTTTTTWSLPSSSIGSTFKIDLYISGASGIWGWSVDSVTWNPGVVQLKSKGGTTEGSYLTQDGDTTLFISGTVDNTYGQLVGGIGDAISDGTQYTIAESSGVLATLTFTVVGVGNANIQFVNPFLRVGTSSTKTAASLTNPSVTVSPPLGTVMYALAVTSDKNYGTPSPVGTTSYASGSSVTATMTTATYANQGITYVCTGWTGTGSVPASGTSTSTGPLIITQDSTIDWNWQVQGSPTPTPSSSPPSSTSPNPTPSTTPTSTPTPQPSSVGISLTVSSFYGSSTPSVGSHTYNSGDSVTCSVPTTPMSINGITYNTLTAGSVTYVCTGWTGTGSAPAGGTSTSTGPFTITQTSTITWNWILAPASIDIWTNKGGQGWLTSSNIYGPQEQVNLFANVTSPGCVSAPQQLVTFNIYGNSAQIGSLTANTNSNGLATATYRLPWSDTNPTSAFGIINVTSTVTLSGTSGNVLVDSCAFMYNYLLNITRVSITNHDSQTTSSNMPSFSRYNGPTVSITATVKNYNWSTTDNSKTNFYLSGTLCDSNNVPVAYQLMPETISPVVSQTCNPSNSITANFVLTLSIPSYAFVGTATLYVNIYSDNPTHLGVPFCPEASTSLIIDAS